MSNTTFVNQSTVIVADWLNDVNDVVYDVLGTGTAVPGSAAEVRQNIGAVDSTGTEATGTWPINITGTAGGVADSSITLAKLASNVVEMLLPTGLVAPFARNTPPAGWIKANGAAVSRTTYANLFAAIGTTFGVGDGSTTFNVPDLRGEFVRGWDDGRSIDPARTFGSAQGYQTRADYGRFNSATNVQANQLSTIARLSQAHVSSDELGSLNGNSFGAETRPRNVALLYCIKT